MGVANVRTEVVLAACELVKLEVVTSVSFPVPEGKRVVDSEELPVPSVPFTMAT